MAETGLQGLPARLVTEMSRALAPEFASRSVDLPLPSPTPRPLWLWPNLLSLDAVIVALLWQQVFASAVSVSLSAAERSGLAFAVWAIYLADRTLDSWNHAKLPSARHIFYREHRTLASLLAGFALAAEAVACCFLSRSVMLAGLALSGLVAFHFLTVHTRLAFDKRLPKEISVAAVFAAGVALVPLVKSRFDPSLISAAFLFAMLCALNCASVEYGEWQHFGSEQPAQPSTSAVWLTRRLRPVAVAMALVAVALVVATSGRQLYGGIAASALALIWFNQTYARMSADAMRVTADLSLLAPVLLLLATPYGL